MTWKRELAFWTFMLIVAFWFMFALVETGKFISNHWGARVAIERTQ